MTASLLNPTPDPITPDTPSATDDTEYVVLYTQLNRVGVDEDGEDVENLTRGQVFKASDVTAKELKRWLKMVPPPIRSKADVDAAAVSAADALAQLEEAKAQVAELQAQLAVANAGGAEHGDADALDADGDGKLDEPAPNGSRKAWASYALQQNPDDAEFVNDTNTTRDMLAEKYGTKGD